LDDYEQKCEEVLNFFVSKLPLYFSSTRLTLLLTLLDIPLDHLRAFRSVWGHIIPLPPRLRKIDEGAFNLSSVSHISGVDWSIFRDFLDSGYPFALDGQRYAAAALACLKIKFQAPHSWPTPRVHRSQRYREDLKHHAALQKPKTSWHQRPRFLLYRMPYLSSQVIHRNPQVLRDFEHEVEAQHIRSVHVKFLLEKAAYSNSLLNFARRRVFRFGYPHQNHPTHMKKAIYALAKYIHRVTGETAEVRACESIWGRKGWFSAD
jgi:hypothetical protein